MKTLVLVRHAKSSWKDVTLADRDRPLNKRGKRDAPEMGRRLAAGGGAPDLIVSSPAARALATARIIAEAVGYPASGIREHEALYMASAAELLEAIRDFDDEHDRVFVVGHNPGLTELVNELSEPAVENVPTCGVVEFRLTGERWAELSRETVRRANLYTPKDREPGDKGASP